MSNVRSFSFPVPSETPNCPSDSATRFADAPSASDLRAMVAAVTTVSGSARTVLKRLPHARWVPIRVSVPSVGKEAPSALVPIPVSATESASHPLTARVATVKFASGWVRHSELSVCRTLITSAESHSFA